MSIIALILHKDIFIKILFLNYISGLVILLISIISLYLYKNSYIDIAIIYAILSFIASVGFLNYFKIKKERKDDE
jgi:multisubunit Na+/H+ antiporter MnhF subunit